MESVTTMAGPAVTLLDAPPTVIVLWTVVTALAAPVVLYGSWRLIRLASIDAATLMDVVRRLMSAGNRERALRLTHADPEAPTLRLLAFALRLRLPPADPDAVLGDGYREGAIGRPIEARAREVLHGRAALEAAPAEAWWQRVMVAATPVVLVAVPALVTRVGPTGAVAGFTLGTVALAVLATVQRDKVRGSLERVADAMAPFVRPEGAEDTDPDADPDDIPGDVQGDAPQGPETPTKG